MALPDSIGGPVGTVALDDFAKTDCIMFFGQNPGSNCPRMLHPLQEASRARRADHHLQPAARARARAFLNPQSPGGDADRQAKPGSARSIIRSRRAATSRRWPGICKAVLAMHDESKAAGRRRVLDDGFIAEHTHGFEAFAAWLRSQDWDELERRSGLRRAAHGSHRRRSTAESHAVIGIYGMGLTQHRAGVETVQMLVNLLLLRGNIGRDGAGICPVRGHSNVQGQRTVGITEKPELVPLDRLAEQYGFEPPRENGSTRSRPARRSSTDEVRAFFMLGGNFVRAIPDRGQMEPAWRKLRLTVQCRHQAEPQPSGARRGQLHPAGASAASRWTSAGERPAGALDGGQHRLHPRLARRAQAGLPAPDQRDAAGLPNSPRRSLAAEPAACRGTPG